jgi:preprotein translocase subunit SecG
MFEAILWVLFVLACIVVSGVILLQEGKGGGLSEAFGGAGQQTFGVKAEGINKFTGWAAFVVVILAITITRVRSGESIVPVTEAPPMSAPGASEPGPGEQGMSEPGTTEPGATQPAPEQPAAPPSEAPPAEAPK